MEMKVWAYSETKFILVHISDSTHSSHESIEKTVLQERQLQKALPEA
jgi:hypothetical protein